MLPAVYWKLKEPHFAEPVWDRDALVDGLAPFDPARPRPLTPHEQAYCQYYGLDLEIERPDISHQLGYVQVDRYRIALHYYRQPAARGTVFVFHGYFDHAGLYSQIFEHCLSEGFDVVCYDQPGHGLSGGIPTSIRCFGDYQVVLNGILGHLQTCLTTPWFAIGQSTGGAVLLDYLLSNGHTQDSSAFREVILLAPLIRPMGWLPGKLLHTLVRPFVTTWKRAFSENSSNSLFIKFLREHDPLQSRVMAVDWISALRVWIERIEAISPIDMHVTVIQGELDLTVDWPHNLRVIRNKFRQARIVRLPQGRHHLVNESPAMLGEIFAVISQTFAPRSPQSTDGTD